MNFLENNISGAVRAIKSWKGILIIWIFTLILISLLVLPFKTGLNSVLGRSMITEKLANGINVDVLSGLGSNLLTIVSSLSAGMILIIIFGFLMNVFLNGGLFSSLRNSDKKFSSSLFFGGAGANFWSFLVITIIMTMIIHFIGFIIIGIPLVIVSLSETASEGSSFTISRIAGVIFLLILPVFLLVTDYARAWQAASSKQECFRAIGNGFRQTFRHFFSSYLVMAIILIVQALFTWLVFKIISGWRPVSGGGVLLLFLLSQLLFIIKILLRAWRYGSVTAVYEKHP